MSKRRVVYCLVDPRDGAIRYVGCSTNGRSRIREHVCHSAKGKSRRDAWIRDLRAAGLRPIYRELEECSDDWQADERRWIAALRREGAPLTNETIGGAGSPGYRPKPESVAMRTAKLRGRVAPPVSDETRRRMSEAHKRLTPGAIARRLEAAARPKSPETIERMSAAQRGKTLSAESRRKISEANRNPSDEVREKLRAAVLARPQSQRDAFAKANLGRSFSEEHKAKIAAGRRRYWAARRSQQEKTDET